MKLLEVLEALALVENKSFIFSERKKIKYVNYTKRQWF